MKIAEQENVKIETNKSKNKKKLNSNMQREKI